MADADGAVEPDSQGFCNQKLAQLGNPAPVEGKEIIVDVDVPDPEAPSQIPHMRIDVGGAVVPEGALKNRAVAV